MNEQESKNKRIAWLIAAVFHAVILVVLSFVNMLQNPPFPESQIVEFAMADFGSTLDGSGDTQPDNVGEASNASAADVVETSPPVPTQGNEQQILEDVNSTVAVKSSDKKKDQIKKEEPIATPSKEEVKPELPKVNPVKLYQGNKNKNAGGSAGGSQGDTEGIGDRGNPNGAQGGRGVLGGGNGSWTLNGRNMVSAATLPSPDEEGIVTLRIKVDRLGNVIGAETILSQCTTTSEKLFSLAKRAALQCKFDARTDVAPEQTGVMSFKFILR